MGLNRTSTGRSSGKYNSPPHREGDIQVALAGNPNVGKSTVFNSLTGLHQHTGNWTGKTVTSAVGFSEDGDLRYALYDLPGCYSLSSRSAEEEVARDFIYFGGSAVSAVVCDAACLERNLYLALQILEASTNTAIVINLVDEAEKKGLSVRPRLLSERLGVPVGSMSARRGAQARRLLPLLREAQDTEPSYEISYPQPVENYITDAGALLFGQGITRRQARVLALRVLDSPPEFVSRLAAYYGISDSSLTLISSLAERMKRAYYGGNSEKVIDRLAQAISHAAEQLARGVVAEIEDEIEDGNPCLYTPSDPKHKPNDKRALGDGSAADCPLDSCKEIGTSESSNTHEGGNTQDNCNAKEEGGTYSIGNNREGVSTYLGGNAREGSNTQDNCNAKEARRNSRRELDRKIDRFLIGKWTAFPIMALLLLGILWITVKGANYPSELLSGLFSSLEAHCQSLLLSLGAPDILRGMLCEGVIRVTGWVVAVMLPPMAIFFPLFTLLEDVGYLPRIAFNLDLCFKKCKTCGKQALTMCMGLGCNASGIVGCRIIDSRRERLIAILTNSFMPCNGRFPMLIALITMFFSLGSGILQAGILTLIIIACVAFTLLTSSLLSKTVLRGVPSSFALELPPYRTPQIGRVIVRSMLDRTLFVLGRAVAIAAPTGLVIWCLANFTVGEGSLLAFLSSLLDPIGLFFGLDGVILIAFLLGLPANEIVIPIILLCYTKSGGLAEYSSLATLKALLMQNGWTVLTAVNMVIMTVFHSPCSTSLITVKKETGSLGITVASAALPSAIGLALCLLTRLIFG